MSALQKLGVAVAILAAGVELGTSAAQLPQHSDNVRVDVEILAAAGAVLALAGALGYAREIGRLRAAWQVELEASERPPAGNPAAEAALNAAFTAGYSEGERAGYASGFTAGASPSTGRHAMETTQVDLSAVADTTEMGTVADETVEELAAQASADAAAPGSFGGFFTAASMRQAARRAA